jgi:mitogen-activated protein kinase kinase kinase
MAPEVVRQTAHTRQADIWSVGCLVIEMLTGQRPWGALDQMQVMFRVRFAHPFPFPSSLSSLRSNKELTLGHPSSATPQIGSSGKPDFPPDITTDAEDFLNKTLELDHIKRPSAAECLSHPFIIQNLAPTL